MDNATMELQERTHQLEEVTNALNYVEDSASQKTNIAFSSSPRGSGKTQFIKWSLGKLRLGALTCGRVIVRCCDRAKKAEQPWLTKVMGQETRKGLCELIRGHVATVTGRSQAPEDYSTPDKAYETWMRVTAQYFRIPDGAKDIDPVIVLCEVLAGVLDTSRMHGSNGKPYTLLESFCIGVPLPHCIVVIGCNAEIDEAKVTATSANIWNIGPLQPLSEKGHGEAIERSWKVQIDEIVRETVHQLSGGVPRLLRGAHGSKQTVSLAFGSFNELPSCFESFKSFAATTYRIEGKWVFLAYTCLLASSTKAIVRGDDPIPINPAWINEWKKTPWGEGSLLPTYKDASLASIGTYIPDPSDSTEETGHFVVPPIIFLDGHAKLGAPIMPSDLHPFLNADVVRHFGGKSDVDRGRQFEKPFMYAVYARYLLELWKDDTNRWVSLAKVFEGAVHPDQKNVLERYEVNLSVGVDENVLLGAFKNATKRALSYLGASYHHDAYIWCRKKGNPQVAAEFALPLQLRHGQPKELKDLEDQLCKTKGAEDKVKLLFSVNPKVVCVIESQKDTVVMINADCMSSIS